MGQTTHYELQLFDFSGTGWNGAYSSNFERIDDLIYDVATTASGADGDLETHKSADDHTIYAKADGSRGFSSTVSGVDPVDDDDLATKGYVDDEISTTVSGWTGSIPTISGTITVNNGLITNYA